MNQSAVQFSTTRRIHISLAVRDVERSGAFYEALFGVAPTKVRPDYARFEVDEPPLNLSILQSSSASGPSDATSHFGVQVKSTDSVMQELERLQSLGLATRIEEAVTCCHAVQDKFWVEDPDGHRWEVFVVLDDTPREVAANAACCDDEAAATCCPPRVESCCTGND